MEDMDWRRLSGLLPNREPDELLREVRDTGAYEDELGGDALLFRRESVEPDAQFGGFGEIYGGTRRMWGARCCCTACGDEFDAGWVKGGGIALMQGDEGGFWPGVPDEDGPDLIVQLGSGDNIACPLCGERVTLIRTSEVGRGIKRQLLGQTVHEIPLDGVTYAVIMVWMMSHTLHNWGMERDIFPIEAFVLGADGRLTRLSKARYNGMGHTTEPLTGWFSVKTTIEPMALRYFDTMANSSTKVGGLTVWQPGRSLDGTTAEKTGLAAYLDAGGKHPVTYLRLWRMQPHVENLVRGGWAHTVRDHVDESVALRLASGAAAAQIGVPKILWANMKEAKPGRMLGVPKNEVGPLGRMHLSAQDMEVLSDYRADHPDAALGTLAGQLRALGKWGIRWAAEKHLPPERLLRYLQKQTGELRTNLTMLQDLWRAADALGMPHTDEVRFPRDLSAAHDRYTAMRQATKTERERAEYAEGFARIAEKYGYLEWSDGELCVILPRDNGELIDEGRTLRHCVGGYGAAHVSGRDVIFFVRHARRPERSYYTLDIRMTGKRPTEVQLHGYGNERHGAHKQYGHRIPKKVRDFCDRWEREILLPRWTAEQRRIAAEKKRNERAKNREENVA